MAIHLGNTVVPISVGFILHSTPAQSSWVPSRPITADTPQAKGGPTIFRLALKRSCSFKKAQRSVGGSVAEDRKLLPLHLDIIFFEHVFQWGEKSIAHKTNDQSGKKFA